MNNYVDTQWPLLKDIYQVDTRIRSDRVSAYPPIFRGCFKVAGYSAVKPTNADNIHRPLQKDWEADVLSAIQKGHC